MGRARTNDDPTFLDGLVEDLAAEAKRYTRAVSAKDRHRRLADAAVRFVIDAAIGLGDDPVVLRDLERRLLAAVTKRMGT